MSKEYMVLEAMYMQKNGSQEIYFCRIPEDEPVVVEDITSEEAQERCMAYLRGIDRLMDEE